MLAPVMGHGGVVTASVVDNKDDSFTTFISCRQLAGDVAGKLRLLLCLNHSPCPSDQMSGLGPMALVPS